MGANCRSICARGMCELLECPSFTSTVTVSPLLHRSRLKMEIHILAGDGLRTHVIVSCIVYIKNVNIYRAECYSLFLKISCTAIHKNYGHVRGAT